MKYPSFIKEKETIGICALSAGVGKKLIDFDKAIKRLSKTFAIKESESVRTNNIRSNTAKIRAKEFNELIKEEEVKLIAIAAGGDFLFETLPYIDFNNVKNNPKWVMGYSDPTSVLYTITTKYDIATLYGCNGGSYSLNHACIDNNLEIIQGNLIPQSSFKKYQLTKDWLEDINEYNGDVKWELSKEEINVTGRCIGGCIDVLKDLIGTSFDDTKAFIERYKEDGFIWYFDNFAMSAENFYRTLLQMKYAGYFNYTKAIIVGRVCFESSETGMTYQEAMHLALEDIPYIFNADIGHVTPKMTLINGAIMHVKANEQKAEITFTLK